ncbi:GIY-YIG nuclease family protein [Sinanaerobacter chloroacetimidivorans]|jgi:putative endonuclease|uniref:GIY-YIG nuclease family protein n=1 Tax=Sinanaerobacter chloroacetimidivorans TaxID=2818044 RepID=A0A8J8B1J6_9FIRM|nr:GIY-YIG nuclease family protein [Sinanaerobacter chloroacetimidivorans]MBR0598314.1 GIY-YIG nuclease family protein [Sinanaerobacter chloroacetimidivorans]
MSVNFAYIVICGDNTLYTGWTNNLEARMMAHNQGQGAKYTRGRLPVRLVYSEAFDTKLEAQKREREIKKLTRKQKLDLISGRAKKGGTLS